ncbi:MAG: LPS assembly protein LptD [Planctomycetota bacterium]
MRKGNGPKQIRRAWTLAVAAGLAIGCGAPTLAQPVGGPSGQPSQPADSQIFDGRTFGGTRLGIAVTPGDISFASQRAWSWREVDIDGRSTIRIALDGDVSAQIGTYIFRASRATAWIQRIGAGGVGDVEGIYQVFAFFEDVRAEGGGVVARSETLPVQALIAAPRPVGLITDLRLNGPPETGRIVQTVVEGEEALARTLAQRNRGIAEMDLRPPEPLDDRRRTAQGPAPARTEDTRAPLFTSEGVFFFSVGERITIEPRQGETIAYLTGGLVVQYESAGQTVELLAQRGVVFLDGDENESALGGPIAAERVTGIYLEGGVRATDGEYRVEMPAAFYDVENDRALLLDAVFETFAPQIGSPIYIRAESIRQRAAEEFVAKKATVANTGFFRPHLSIGASTLTLTKKENIYGEERPNIDARGITLRAGALPVGWLPFFKGDPERFPLRGIGFADSNRTGPVFSTEWDFFSLLGREGPPGFDVGLDLDYYADRGLGIGTQTDWRGDSYEGELLAYTVPDDQGEDVLANGTELDRNGEFRGIAYARHRWQVRPEWTLIAEGVSISDEAFLQVFAPELASDGDELTTRAFLRRLEGNSLLTFEVQGQALDDVLNENLLQSVGYTVDRFPEVRATQQAIDLLPDWKPGAVTYTWDASYGLLRLRFSETPVEDFGLTRIEESQRIFDVLPTQSLGDSFRAAGLDESYINRFDTRHEIAGTFDYGPIKFNPFVVGRLTAYDTSFDDFSPGEDEDARVWGAVGARVSTSIQRVDNTIESRTFDLHRLRHVIEPSVTAWYAGTNVNNTELPVIDDDVEAIIDGGTVRVGLDQVWQTKRGGPGRWYDADVFRLSAAYVYNSEDDDVESSIGRFFDARPELSVPGEYFDVSAAWQVSDAVSLSGEVIYDVLADEPDRTSGGILVDHGRGLSTSSELRYLENQDVTFWSTAVRFQPTKKYEVIGATRYDFDRSEFANFRATVLRSFPNAQIGVTINFSAIRDETTFGLVFRPSGVFGSPGAGGFGGAGQPFGRNGG